MRFPALSASWVNLGVTIGSVDYLYLMPLAKETTALLV